MKNETERKDDLTTCFERLTPQNQKLLNWIAERLAEVEALAKQQEACKAQG